MTYFRFSSFHFSLLNSYLIFMVFINIIAAVGLQVHMTAMDNLHDLALNITHVHTAAIGRESYAAVLISTPAVLLIKVWATREGWGRCASLQPQNPLRFAWCFWWYPDTNHIQLYWRVCRCIVSFTHLYTPTVKGRPAVLKKEEIQFVLMYKDGDSLDEWEIFKENFSNLHPA